uniref:HUN domain-containing protein n=1 Tax=Caenorhabditis tropicalis TaxID=1561998 RepID=A0A1I7TKL6_9PELO
MDSCDGVYEFGGPKKQFQIAYESRYLKKSNEQIGDPEVEEVGLRKNSTYDAEIETVRNDTMNHENFDFSHHSEDEREPIVNRNDSVDCNPNNTTKSDERRVLQSEYVSERLISRPRDVPQEVEMESEKLEHQDKDEAVLPEKLAKKGSKRSQIARKRKEYEVLPKDARDASKPQKKKCARRLMKPIDETNCSEEGRSTQTIEIDRDQNIISLDQNLNETVEPKKKKTCRSPVTKSVIPEADELIATNLGTSKSNDVHKTETYGRVKSLKELCHDISREPEQATRQIETRENTPKRLQYGSSCNIVDPKKKKQKEMQLTMKKKIQLILSETTLVYLVYYV